MTLASLAKATQTLRRTVAPRDKLDTQASARRQGLHAERVRPRTERAAEHKRAKTDAVLEGFADALPPTRPMRSTTLTSTT